MKLSEDSLNWTKKHITKYYDSDFFVKPFEFKALWANWNEVLFHLSNNNLENLITSVKRPVVYPTPKHSGGFRMVHQLDPLDTIIYTAMTREIASLVEAKRVDSKENVVFSYRINIDDHGELFESENGYEKFIDKSTALAASYDYVLLTDITDFYNQIYHHRLQNSIQSCDSGLDEISVLIERFMMELTNNVSRGIPVGPSASIVMAEALLIDIDEFILNKDLPYIRYVDDMRIFSNSKEQLNIFLHDLTAYLYANHRLTLSSLKTKVITSDDYLSEYIEDPLESEKVEIHNAIKLLDHRVTGGYGILEMTTLDNLPSENKIKAQGKAFQLLLSRIVNIGKLDLGLSRHILRRSKHLKSRAILNDLLSNFDYFTPVIRDVILYLEAITNEKMFERSIPQFENIITHSPAINIPHIRYWLSHYFASVKFTRKSQLLSRFVTQHGTLREQGLYAIEQRRISWVRENKDRIDQVGPWERRMILYSSQILSKDERNHWMNALSRRDDIVDKSITHYIKSFT